MDDMNAEWLFGQIVADKIKSTDYGLIEIPLGAMREYCNTLKLSPNQGCMVGVQLEGGEEGFYNYVLTENSDNEASITVTEVYYYDEETGDSDEIVAGNLLYKSIRRDLFSGKSLVSGLIGVDQDGKIYLQVMHSEDIGVELFLEVDDRREGFQLATSNFARSYNIWRYEDKLLIAPSLFSGCDGLPS